ncbi:MAG: DUF998 domain-containing protein [Thermoleophilia bacterium]
MARWGKPRSRSTPWLRSAGALSFIAGAAALLGIITAEALYPDGYSTGASMISDLGGTEPPNSIVVEPSATIFDTTMMSTGLLVIVAAVLLYVARRRLTLVVPIAVFGLGAFGVGAFPGSTGLPHNIFALTTFFAGGVAAVFSAGILKGPFRVLALVLGAVSLVNLIAYFILQERWFVADLGLGGLERWIAYPIVVWLLGFGGYLMAGPPADER